MLQKTFKIDESYTLAQFLDEIEVDEDRLSSRESLLIVYYPADQDDERLTSLVGEIGGRLEGTHVIGMTTVFTLGPQYILENRIVCSLITFDTCRLVIRGYNLDVVSLQDAATDFIDEVENERYLKGVLCLAATLQQSVLPFINPLVDELEVPVFGSLAGIHSSGDPGLWVFSEGTVYGNGIVAVALCGKHLDILTDDNMAWHPIGRSLTITGTASNDLVVTSIDNQPAISVYEKYLDVEQDDSFVANVCAFPFLVDTGDHYVARVPLFPNPDGSLTFSVPMPLGQKIVLSYAKDEYLLKQANASANKMGEFQADALLLIPCINRRIFMGNEPADREISYFERSNPNLAVGSGCGEILVTTAGGSVLNSSLVAIAMREGERDPERTFEPYEDPALKSNPSEPVPLVTRLATFLEAVTYDLEQMANRDQLTGIYNRRRTEEFLEHALSTRHGGGVYLIMYDVDHFKSVNDTYGHSVGDLALRQLTECLTGTLRPEDILGRWGGEEFMCIIECASIDDATAVAERMRTTVEAYEFDTVGQLTISLGVTEAHEDDTADSLFLRVDEGLYQSKNTGRNRVTVV